VGIELLPSLRGAAGGSPIALTPKRVASTGVYGAGAGLPHVVALAVLFPIALALIPVTLALIPVVLVVLVLALAVPVLVVLILVLCVGVIAGSLLALVAAFVVVAVVAVHFVIAVHFVVAVICSINAVTICVVAGLVVVVLFIVVLLVVVLPVVVLLVVVLLVVVVVDIRALEPHGHSYLRGEVGNTSRVEVLRGRHTHSAGFQGLLGTITEILVIRNNRN
jgi:hypothetical protein